MKRTTATLLLTILLTPILTAYAQIDEKTPVFNKIKIMKQKGDEIYQRSVIVTFLDDEMTIDTKSGADKKIFKYADIKGAEYSYSKTPRWKTGLGLGAAGFVFPPLFLIALPIGFTKHRRHWLTIRTEEDYAVLKLSKKNRKLFMPTFETKTGVTIKAVGEDK